MESEESYEIVEDAIYISINYLSNHWPKKCLDTLNLGCMSCLKLCHSRNVSSIEHLRKPTGTIIWKNSLDYYNGGKKNHTMHICHSFLVKIRNNQNVISAIDD